MKKFIALVALVLVSASTMMYAQESNAAARRAERKAQRDAERAKLRAEEEVQDMAAYAEQVFFVRETGEPTRRAAYHGFVDMFEPGNIVDIALAGQVNGVLTGS